MRHAPQRIFERSFASFSTTRQSLPKSGSVESAKQLFPNAPSIILVSPFVDQNIGSVARTMMNFGMSDLRIVNPLCEVKSNPNIVATAAGGYEIVEKAKIFSCLSEAVQDLHRIFATTVRPRHMTQVIMKPRKASEEIVHMDGKAGILFGTERSGLTNDEVSMADTIITIPSSPTFSSLNLAHAVNLISYELWQARLDQMGSTIPEARFQPKDIGDVTFATRGSIEAFLTRLENSLDKSGRQIDKRAQTSRDLRVLFSRMEMTKSEVDLLHSVLGLLTKNDAS